MFDWLASSHRYAVLDTRTGQELGTVSAASIDEAIPLARLQFPDVPPESLRVVYDYLTEW